MPPRRVSSSSSSRQEPPTIVATLCDSRTCNQTGGGEHLQPDIEDFLRLLPLVHQHDHDHDDAQSTPQPSSQSQSRGMTSKVTLTTCMGMCNRSPNMVLQTRAGLSLKFRKGGKLRNDGGLRMRVDDSDDEEKKSDESDTSSSSNESESSDTSSDEEPSSRGRTRGRTHRGHRPTRKNKTDKIIINDVTIPKLAHILGFENENLIRACDNQQKGRRSLVAGCHREALSYFLNGRLHCQQEETEGDASMSRVATRQLQASLCVLCAKSRVHHAKNTGTSRQERIQSLELAALESFRVLDSSTCSTDWSLGIDDDLRGVIGEVVDSAAGNALRSKLLSGVDVEVAFGVDEDGNGVEFDETIAISGYGIRNVGAERIAISSIHPRTLDLKILTQCCIVLAEAWGGLSESITCDDVGKTIIAPCREGDTEQLRASYAEGARLGYKGILAVAATPSYKKLRLFRVKERRRIEKAVASLL